MAPHRHSMRDQSAGTAPDDGVESVERQAPSLNQQAGGVFPVDWLPAPEVLQSSDGIFPVPSKFPADRAWLPFPAACQVSFQVAVWNGVWWSGEQDEQAHRFRCRVKDTISHPSQTSPYYPNGAGLTSTDPYPEACNFLIGSFTRLPRFRHSVLSLEDMRCRPNCAVVPTATGQKRSRVRNPWLWDRVSYSIEWQTGQLQQAIVVFRHLVSHGAFANASRRG